MHWSMTFFIASLDFAIHRKSCNQLPADTKRKLNLGVIILHTDFFFKVSTPSCRGCSWEARGILWLQNFLPLGGQSVLWKGFGQRISQWLNCVTWERRLRLTYLKYMVHTPPPSAKLLSLPHPAGLSATEEEHRAGILGLSCWIWWHGGARDPHRAGFFGLYLPGRLLSGNERGEWKVL